VGGVAFVTGQYGSAPLVGIPPPVLLAFAAHDPQSSNRISQGLIAVAPAETPILTDLGNVPRVAKNGPVQVFRSLYGQTHLVTRLTPRGLVKAIALSFPQLAVLVERADGTKAIERYNPKSGTLIATTAVPSGVRPLHSASATPESSTASGAGSICSAMANRSVSGTRAPHRSVFRSRAIGSRGRST
jgi:hypothetical protein